MSIDRRNFITLLGATFIPLPGFDISEDSQSCEIVMLSGGVEVTNRVPMLFKMNSTMTVTIRVSKPVDLDGVRMYRHGKVFLQRDFEVLHMRPDCTLDVDWKVFDA